MQNNNNTKEEYKKLILKVKFIITQLLFITQDSVSNNDTSLPYHLSVSVCETERSNLKLSMWNNLIEKSTPYFHCLHKMKNSIYVGKTFLAHIL